VRVYFSHSYRDKSINAYFLRQLIGVFRHDHEDQDFDLVADQKSPTWCVAKLERYLSELTGFISVVPRRASENEVVAFSPFISSELSLGRRFGLPRLVFVDDKVLSNHRALFPDDAVPFAQEALDSDAFIHREAFEKFKNNILRGGKVRPRQYEARSVAVFSSTSREIAKATKAVIEILRTEGYVPKLIHTSETSNMLEDVDFLEIICGRELCVFLLDKKAGPTDVALAIAHARCIPSIRLQFQPYTKIFEPLPSGRVPWSTLENLVSAFLEQLTKFRTGLVETVTLAEETTVEEAVRIVGTASWEPTPDHLWRSHDGPGLSKHIQPSHPLIRDEVSRVRKMLQSGLIFRDSHEICLHLYTEFRRHHFAYEHEQKSLTKGEQAIRTVSDVFLIKAATCLDMACIFASLLVSANQVAVIIVLDDAVFSHALVGYKAPNGVLWESDPTLGAVRAAANLDDLVIFEPTGAIEADGRVAGETDEERRLGGKEDT
jgi:hypothetical protein